MGSYEKLSKKVFKVYVKNNFLKANGVYHEVFDDGFVLHEFGYEVKI